MKPEGVGINKINVKDLVLFGQAKGFITDDDLINCVPMIGSLLPDWAIRQFVTIEDFVDYGECPPGVVSYGLTSTGYDIRVGYKFKVFTNAECATVDPKNMKTNAFRDFDLTPEVGAPKPNYIMIPPNCFALAESLEVIHVPRNVCCWCVGKSTWARCGVITAFTPFEAGWFGIVTVEISNSGPIPVKIYAGEGIGQAQFVLTIGGPEKGYGEKKNARYQGQAGITLPRVI